MTRNNSSRTVRRLSTPVVVGLVLVLWPVKHVEAQSCNAKCDDCLIFPWEVSVFVQLNGGWWDDTFGCANVECPRPCWPGFADAPDVIAPGEEMTAVIAAAISGRVEDLQALVNGKRNVRLDIPRRVLQLLAVRECVAAAATTVVYAQARLKPIQVAALSGAVPSIIAAPLALSTTDSVETRVP